MSQVEGLRAWAPAGLSALFVLALGSAEARLNAEPYRFVASYPSEIARGVLLTFLFAVAVCLHRLRPALATGIVIIACTYQLLTGTGMQLAQVGVVLVAYGAARYGSTATMWASGAFIPIAALVAIGVGSQLTAVTPVLFESRFGDVLIDLVGSLTRRGALVSLGLMAFVLLAVPWLIGVSLRLRSESQSSRLEQRHAEQERSQAVQLAAVREEQAQLAHDVHDVVGHSLAVILAQAESAQFLPDEDTAQLKQTLATIAKSARGSLVDVRQVLAAGRPATPPPASRFDQLVAGVRASGHDVNVRDVGQPVPLPPEIGAVTHRVVQEMLTNAIKHGCRGGTIDIERRWDRELRLAVVNAVPDDTTAATTSPPSPSDPPGLGLVGMRRRLESVGGRLEAGPGATTDGPVTWRCVAHLPLRAQEVRLR